MAQAVATPSMVISIKKCSLAASPTAATASAPSEPTINTSAMPKKDCNSICAATGKASTITVRHKEAGKAEGDVWVEIAVTYASGKGMAEGAHYSTAIGQALCQTMLMPMKYSNRGFTVAKTAGPGAAP